jgi:hypothetical protein
MPQFTMFILSLAYVASGPVLYLRGDRIQKLPFLHPVESNGDASYASSGSSPNGSADDDASDRGVADRGVADREGTRADTRIDPRDG